MRDGGSGEGEGGDTELEMFVVFINLKIEREICRCKR